MTAIRYADVVIVGAGGSGAPLAARLSEDPARQVVVLEAGPAPRRVRDFPRELLDPRTVEGAMPGHPHNWSYLGHLTPDLPYTIARGRILGGSTTLNGGYFVRPRREDFDSWARVAGDEWSFEAMLPVMRRLEADPLRGPWHGTDGPMPIHRSRQSTPLAVAFTNAARELGFPAEPDKNAPSAPGVGPVPLNVRRGRRWNTGLAYLLPALERPNLEVRGDARARRVLLDQGRAVGVELANGELVRAGEVVLAAGAIASPHLLLVSGIGPRAELERFGIPVVADLPVGVAFADHPDLAIGWRPRQPIADPGEGVAFPTALNFSSSPGYPQGDLEILLAGSSLGYLLTGSTSILTGGGRAALRHPLRTLRALAGVSGRRLAAQLAHADDLQLIVSLQRPLGRGTIALASADPGTPPRIDYRYLEEEHDRARLRTGIRTAVALLRSVAFAAVFDRLTELDDATLRNDDALDTWMRSHLGTAIHLCASAPMGDAHAKGSVVDAAGRVHGVPGLRVADTSILPDVPSRGPAAAAIIVGERIAELMAGE